MYRGLRGIEDDPFNPWLYTNTPDVQAYRDNPTIGGCHVLNEAMNQCAYGPTGSIACNLLRECDVFTGGSHYEYQTPQPTGNVNISVMDSSGKVISRYVPPKPDLSESKMIIPDYMPVGGTVIPANYVAASQAPTASNTNVGSGGSSNYVGDTIASIKSATSSLPSWWPIAAIAVVGFMMFRGK